MLKDSTILMVIIVGTLVLLLLVGITFALLYLNDKKRHKYQEQLQLLKSEYEQTLLQSQLEIQEQTLQHLSRELHDNLGMMASLIKINLNTLKLNETDKAAEKIETTKELTRQLIGDIKSLSVSLGNDRVEQTGLVNALQTEIERLNKSAEFTIQFSTSGGIPPVSNDKAVILYRMAQEILNNMAKHSQASEIKVIMDTKEKIFTLAFSDNGVGFNRQEKLNSPGAGLRNLQHRAQLINAQLRIQSSPGNGTLTTIELPL